MITEKNKKLIERVIGSFDWDAIAKIYKIFEKGVGTDSQKISGISRISYKKVTPDDIKKEITAVVTYIVENDIPSLEYDIWNIIWINGSAVYREPVSKVRAREELILNRFALIWNKLPVFVKSIVSKPN
jgi:hypothetical protein